MTSKYKGWARPDARLAIKRAHRIRYELHHVPMTETRKREKSAELEAIRTTFNL